MDNNGVVILGGGLAGLCASLYSNAPIYEAQAKAGGISSSDTTDGFTFDRGIHILQTENKTIRNLLAERSVSLAKRSRRAFIYSNDTFTAYPFQVNTAGLPLRLRTTCLASYFLRDTHPDPSNYKEWMYKNMGKGFADTFLIPYSEKFWTVSPDQMTYEWTGNRVPQAKTRQVIRGAFVSKQTKVGSNATFEYPEDGSSKGYGAIADALSREAIEINTDHRATNLDVAQRKITFSNGNTVSYEQLISTIPLPELVKICPQAPQEVVDASAKLRTNSILVVNLGIDRANISDKHWIHFPEKENSCFRLSFPHNLSSEVTPKGLSSISAEVAYSDDMPVDKDTITDRVIEDLKRVGVLKPGESIPVKTTYDIKYGYCIYDFERKQAVKTIHKWMKQHQIIPSGRYAMWAYFWSHEAMLSGRKAAKLAMSA